MISLSWNMSRTSKTRVTRATAWLAGSRSIFLMLDLLAAVMLLMVQSTPGWSAASSVQLDLGEAWSGSRSS
jgi:hypothetical protein